MAAVLPVARRYRSEEPRPVRSLLASLPMLAASEGGDIDYTATDPELLQRVGAEAATVCATFNLGIGSIGALLAESSVAIEDGSVSADCVEALGRLLRELGDLAIYCQGLAARSSEFRGSNRL